MKVSQSNKPGNTTNDRNVVDKVKRSKRKNT